MKFQIVSAFTMASLILGVTADFSIYYQEQNTPSSGHNTENNQYIMVSDAEPSCDDLYTEYNLVPLTADASSGNMARCEGCGDLKDIESWDITELELNIKDWGHYTIYKEHDYQLTPSGGGALNGQCTRDPDDEIDCTSGISLDHGQRLFKCKSSMKGAHAA